MQYEVIRYSDRENRRRSGYIVRRLRDGALYLFGFRTERSAAWATSDLKMTERFWVRDPKLVIFDLQQTFMESLK